MPLSKRQPKATKWPDTTEIKKTSEKPSEEPSQETAKRTSENISNILNEWKIALATASIALGIGLPATFGYYLINFTKEQSIESQKQMSRLERQIAVYRESFGQLKKGQYILFTPSGFILERWNFPEEWDNLSKWEKQKFFDAKRNTLSQKHNLENNENTIRLTTPHHHLKWYENNDLTLADIMKNNMYQKVPNDTKNRNYKQFFLEEFSNVTDDTLINNALSQLMIGKIAIESKFINGQISHAGAIGMMQIMPENINPKSGFNPRKYSKTEVAEDVTKQAEIAKRLIQENYQFVNKYTELIAKKYYKWDTRAAKEYFIIPLLINTYNAGSWNMKQVINEFMKICPDEASLRAYLKKDPNSNIWYDVFWTMMELGRMNPKLKNYKTDASEYTTKIMAMTMILR